MKTRAGVSNVADGFVAVAATGWKLSDPAATASDLRHVGWKPSRSSIGHVSVSWEGVRKEALSRNCPYATTNYTLTHSPQYDTASERDSDERLRTESCRADQQDRK